MPALIRSHRYTAEADAAAAAEEERRKAALRTARAQLAATLSAQLAEREAAKHAHDDEEEVRCARDTASRFTAWLVAIDWHPCRMSCGQMPETVHPSQGDACIYTLQAAIKALREGVAAEQARRDAEKAASAAKRVELKAALEAQMKANAARRCGSPCWTCMPSTFQCCLIDDPALHAHVSAT